MLLKNRRNEGGNVEDKAFHWRDPVYLTFVGTPWETKVNKDEGKIQPNCCEQQSSLGHKLSIKRGIKSCAT